MRDLLELLVFAAVIASMLLIAGSLIYVVEVKSCANYESITRRTTEYKFFGGCFVETQGGWSAKSELRKEL